MWDAVSGGVQPQPWHHNVVWAPPYPMISKFGPPPAHVYQCKGASICPCTAYEGAQSLYTNPMWIQGAVNGGLQPQPWHRNIIWAPLYPFCQKFGPHLHRYNSVRVHPYAHPQHMKVLKHFAYFQHGCGMQSMVVDSLNHDTTAHLGSTLPKFSKIWPVSA
jgi:hypothetical protein